MSTTEHAMILDAMRQAGCRCEPDITIDDHVGLEFSASATHDEGCPIMVNRGYGNGAN